MPTKQGGKALKNASTSDRCSFRRNTALPAASAACSWKTRLAMSKPTVVIFMVDGSFSSLHSTARAWHIDAVRGRPPHQILSTSVSPAVFLKWRDKEKKKALKDYPPSARLDDLSSRSPCRSPAVVAQAAFVRGRQRH